MFDIEGFHYLLLGQHGASLNIPPFLGKKVSLSEDVCKTQCIARLRIRAETVMPVIRISDRNTNLVRLSKMFSDFGYDVICIIIYIPRCIAYLRQPLFALCLSSCSPFGILCFGQ